MSLFLNEKCQKLLTNDNLSDIILSKDNPYEWIGRMNNIQACVREVVGTELIYT